MINIFQTRRRARKVRL